MILSIIVSFATGVVRRVRIVGDASTASEFFILALSIKSNHPMVALPAHDPSSQGFTHARGLLLRVALL